MVGAPCSFLKNCLSDEKTLTSRVWRAWDVWSVRETTIIPLSPRSFTVMNWMFPQNPSNTSNSFWPFSRINFVSLTNKLQTHEIWHYPHQPCRTWKCNTDSVKNIWVSTAPFCHRYRAYFPGRTNSGVNACPVVGTTGAKCLATLQVRKVLHLIYNCHIY